MTEHIGRHLARVRTHANVTIATMARHAGEHAGAMPEAVVRFAGTHSTDVLMYSAYLHGLEETPQPASQVIAWHTSLRLCMSDPKDYPYWYQPEAIVQPYNDTNDDRLTQVVRSHTRRAKWWWRINTWPRSRGSWCLICRLPLHDGRPYRHGDTGVLLSILQHRSEHLTTLDSDTIAFSYLSPKDWRTPALTEQVH